MWRRIKEWFTGSPCDGGEPHQWIPLGATTREFLFGSWRCTTCGAVDR